MLKSTKKDSLAGTDKKYVEVENAEGLRVRLMDEKGSTRLRIHVLKKAPAINSRERTKYFAFDVPWESIIKVASKLYSGS